MEIENLILRTRFSSNLQIPLRKESLKTITDIVDLKIVQSDWPRAFWPISQEADFSQVWDLCKNTTNKMNFLYRPNSQKNND